MADLRLSLTTAICVICWTLPCLSGGDRHPAGYVPLNSGKVGVPLSPSFVPPAGAEALDPVQGLVVEEGEMIETAASDLESEASLEEWEDEAQDGGEPAVAYYLGGASSRRASYVDVMLGRGSLHDGLVLLPRDVGLTLIPTGSANGTDGARGANGTDAAGGSGSGGGASGAGGAGSDKARKILCVGRNLTENETATAAVVHLVNNTGLLSTLGMRNETPAASAATAAPPQPNCAVVMFYAPWCPFCTRAAPHYNALARAFPQINVLAIDAVHFSNLNARFGTVAVPNILIFHNAKAVARFNASERTLGFMVEFVANVTGLVPMPNITVEEADWTGPLPSQPTTEPDYLLLLSWVFLISFCAWMFIHSAAGQRLWHNIATLGREPGHQHID